eukprot:EG_transcript_18514
MAEGAPLTFRVDRPDPDAPALAPEAGPHCRRPGRRWLHLCWLLAVAAGLLLVCRGAALPAAARAAWWAAPPTGLRAPSLSRPVPVWLGPGGGRPFSGGVLRRNTPHELVVLEALADQRRLKTTDVKDAEGKEVGERVRDYFPDPQASDDDASTSDDESEDEDDSDDDLAALGEDEDEDGAGNANEETDDDDDDDDDDEAASEESSGESGDDSEDEDESGSSGEEEEEKEEKTDPDTPRKKR